MRTILRRIIPFIVCSLALLWSLNAQPESGTIAVRVHDAGRPGDVPAYVNGFRSAVEGSSIVYHSIHPDAAEALIVRANAAAPSIAWQTDTLPESKSGEPYRIVWLAGIERIGWGNATTPHTFQMAINGAPVFSFTNRKDSTAPRWSMTAPNGAQLRFEAGMTDKYGDLFGYMYLTVPHGLYPSGKPLTIRVTGEHAGSAEWFMVFQYTFNFSPGVRVEPALLRESPAGSRVLRLSLDNLRPGRRVEVVVRGTRIVAESLKVGANLYRVPFDDAGDAASVALAFTVNGAPVLQRTVPIPPVRERTMYFVPHTHNDIGYTDLQSDVERKQWRYLDEAMELIRRTKDYPADARYKWNLEILWPLEGWLRNASPEQRDEFFACVREGSIGLNALFVNPLTGLANAAEMSHYLDYAGVLTKKYGLNISTAAISDIPGFTWGLVPALAQSGVRYFASGPNSGDRIGYTIEQWGDKPFYWASQSGAESVLCWVAGSSYASFHQATLAKSGPDRIMKLMRRLEDIRYPYDMYFLPYTLGDNAGNDTTLSDFVRRWNERYRTPRLVIATHEQLFRDFERQYGASLPVYSGDFTPYWEDGALSTAYETALSRKAADRILQAEAIWSARAPRKFPDILAYHAWRAVSMWDEHTWGADISVSEPDAPKTTGQWRIKRQFALDADSLSKDLLQRALPKALHETGVFDIWNTTSWRRSDIVYLPAAQTRGRDLAADNAGTPLRSQRLSTGELAVLVDDVPAMGSKRIRISAGRVKGRSALRAERNLLENAKYRLSVDEETGAIYSLRWKEDGLDLVDTTRGTGLNRYLYARGINSDSTTGLRNVGITVAEQGPLVAALRITGDAPGCRSYSYEVRMYDGIDRIDLRNDLDKQSVREKEGVHLGFSFNVPDGQLRYDVASGIVRPERDQLPGVCKNFYSVMGWTDISNAEAGVTWATPDAPLIEIGAITAERPWMKTNPAGSTFYSYIMNNYWHTNYKADQEGPVTFAYSLRPHRAFAPAEAARFGLERRQELLAVPVDEDVPESAALCSVLPAEVVVLSARPVEGGSAVQMLLYNPTGTGREISLQRDGNSTVLVTPCDAFGRPVGEAAGGAVRIAGFGTRWVLVSKE